MTSNRSLDRRINGAPRLRRKILRNRSVGASNQSKNSSPFGLLGSLLSPTRFLIELRLRHARTPAERERNASELRRWNFGWCLFELCLLVVTLVISIGAATKGWRHSGQFYLPLCLLALSRINEVSYAFFRDALSRLANEAPNSSLSPRDRVILLLRSYFGLWVNFAVLYYLLPFREGFSKPIENFADALYLSGSTLTALGQEGQELCHYVLKFLSLYQVTCGLLLLVVAISIYIGAAKNDS